MKAAVLTDSFVVVQVVKETPARLFSMYHLRIS